MVAVFKAEVLGIEDGEVGGRFPRELGKRLRRFLEPAVVGVPAVVRRAGPEGNLEGFFTVGLTSRRGLGGVGMGGVGGELDVGDDAVMNK